MSYNFEVIDYLSQMYADITIPESSLSIQGPEQENSEFSRFINFDVTAV